MTEELLGVVEATISLSRRGSGLVERPKKLQVKNNNDVEDQLNAAVAKLVILASPAKDHRPPVSLVPQDMLTPTDNVSVNFVFSAPDDHNSCADELENLGNATNTEAPVMRMSPVPYTRRRTRRLMPAVEEPKKERPVYSLERFKWVKTIGTGTFGRVVLCRDTASAINQGAEYFAMKILRMFDIFKLKQVEHIKDEKRILEMVDHPFIVKLFWSHHDDSNLYMLLEYAPGGELFSYLRSVGRFSNSTAVFYAAEIILALEYLHSKSIVYRDLKPENLIFDEQGHVKITDFGFAKELVDRTWTLCGTPEYLAPEIIQSRGYNKAVDYWAYGILLYEMMAGHPPFFSENPIEVYQKILDGKIRWPKQFDLVAKDLIKKLLVADRTKRLGNMKNGVDDIKAHRWFRSVNWKSCYDREIEPPYVPLVSHPGDCSNFDDYSDEWMDTDQDKPNVTAEQLAVFQDF